MAHLFIIAGHGAGDCGAVGYGYTEAERVRALASRLWFSGGIATDLPPLQTYNTRMYKAVKSELFKNT